MVRSPIAGLLQAVDVEVGEHVNPGQRLARVVSLDRLEVPLQIAAGVRPFLELGEEVRIIGTGTDERVWESTIGRIAPESDPETRTLTIYAEVTQPAATEEGLNGALAPGQFVRALVLATNVQERWVVPRRSVDEGGILIVNDEHIRRRPIEIDYQVEMKLPRFGVKDALWVVLEEPLEPGLPVVINPTPALIEGMQVEPAPAAQPRDVEVRSGAAEEMANAEAGP
jgi:multidrug efflux pump subunit AcrA (membrane-fusion protein)